MFRKKYYNILENNKTNITNKILTKVYKYGNKTLNLILFPFFKKK